MDASHKEWILIQHRSLRRQIERIQSLVSSEFEHAHLSRELADLELTLRGHFTTEEEGPDLLATGQDDPMAGLLDLAHRDLAGTLVTLRSLAESEEDRHSIRRMFLDWAKSMASHEALENQLLEAGSD